MLVVRIFLRFLRHGFNLPFSCWDDHRPNTHSFMGMIIVLVTTRLVYNFPVKIGWMDVVVWWSGLYVWDFLTCFCVCVLDISCVCWLLVRAFLSVIYILIWNFSEVSGDNHRIIKHFVCGSSYLQCGSNHFGSLLVDHVACLGFRGSILQIMCFCINKMPLLLDDLNIWLCAAPLDYFFDMGKCLTSSWSL